MIEETLLTDKGEARNILLVEGSDDAHVMRSLFGYYYIPCVHRGRPEYDQAPPSLIEIRDYEGIDKLLEAFGVELKRSGDRRPGVVIDADVNLAAFSVEAAALPFSIWLDQLIDALLAFHFAHPAFHILLSIPAPSVHFASLADALPKELQTRFELGFRTRVPHLSPTQGRLSATMTVQFFKAGLRLLLQAQEAERRLLVRRVRWAASRTGMCCIERGVR